MPNGLRILSPAPIDSTARLMERLLSMEQRLAALETRRDIVVTPFSLLGGPTSLTPNPDIAYNWNGGRLWILAGGYVAPASGAPLSALIGYQLKWSFMGPGVLLTTPVITYATNGQRGALPSSAVTASDTLSVPGGYTLHTEIYNANTGNYQADGLIIEWSSPA